MNRFGINKEKQTTYPFQTSWTTFVSTQCKFIDSFKPVVCKSSTEAEFFPKEDSDR